MIWHPVSLTQEVGMAPRVTEHADETEAEVLSGEELLVEEVSIDGMCGVY
jgi:mycofactocin precursor